MSILTKGLQQKSKNAERSTKELFKRFRKKAPHDLDVTIQRIHEKVFGKTDCLNCANCCRTLGPRLVDKDIVRLSGYLKLKPSMFTEKYLLLDDDSDYVFRKMPCPFLMDDNCCNVYDERPKACREYPHTDRKKFYQLLDLTLKNTFICPAVYEIIEELKVHYSKQ